MKVRIPILLLLTGWVGLVMAASNATDWNQWRGPLRNGVLPDKTKLADSWSKDGLKKLWESEMIPGNDEGGHGSPVVAGDRVYLSVVWHSDVPSETRTITDLVMRQLGYQNPRAMGKELADKMEAARESLSPQMRGKKLEDFSNKWIEENLSKRQRATMSGFVKGRFKKGRLAIPLPDFEKLQDMVDKPFANDAAFKKWLDEQGFSDNVKQQVINAVPPTMRVAQDTIICLELGTGKTLWKAALPGEPKGRNCSSTPVVAAGKVFAMGSTHLICVDAEKGEVLWSEPLPSKAPGSSPLYADGLVIINAGKLTAYDAVTGKQMWQEAKVGGSNSSPVAWTKDGQTLVILNSRNNISAHELKTGKQVWTAPGGGDSTPAIVDDTLAVQTRNTSLGLVAYKLKLDGAEQLWKFPMDAVRTQSSPVIYNGNVYLMDDGSHYCLSLASGEVRWKQTVPSAISSPLIADGKIFVMMNNGNNLEMLKATPDERLELGKAHVKALWCPSPTISKGRLIVRTQDKLVCYDLTNS